MAYLLRLILLLGVLLVPAVQAQSTINFTDQGEALAACRSDLASRSSWSMPISGAGDFHRANGIIVHNCIPAGTPVARYECSFQTVRWDINGVQTTGFLSNRGCRSPESDGMQRYAFPSTATCASRNATLGGGQRVYVGTPPSCVVGCAMSHGGTVSTTVNGVTLNGTGNTEYNGQTCAAPVGGPVIEKPGPNTADKDKACTPLPGGQTACVKPNGNYCATASTGAEVCWSPTQTGETVNGQALQQRATGLSRPPVPPSTPPPPNLSWNPNNSHQTTSPQNGSFTIINFSTVPGDNGNTNIDGSGNTSEDDPEDPGSAGGGGDCATAPACSGGADNAAIQCAIVQQAWLGRCGATIAENGVACTAESPLVCTGMSQADCYIAAQIKRSQCSLASINEALTGNGETMPETSTPSPFAEGDGESSGNGPEINNQGWLSNRTCPAIPDVSVMGYTLSIGSHMGLVCGFLDVTSMLVLVFAAFFVARILGET